MKLFVIGFIIQTRFYSPKSDFQKSNQSLRQFISFINCTFGSIIYLGSNVVMTAGPSSYKSRFIYHFMIMYKEKEFSFNGGLMEKL